MSDEESPNRATGWATCGRGLGGEYTWFDPNTTASQAWGRHLPHWRQPGALYFVTCRTDDSIPASVLSAWRQERDAWLAVHPEPHDAATEREFHRRFTARWHRFLDAGHGACPFRDPGVREIVIAALHYHDGTEYALDEYVVMPNHVHALVSPNDGAELSDITKAWKSVTAHRINRRLGRSGGLWQQESWDHIVRDADYMERYRRYIRQNPGFIPDE